MMRSDPVLLDSSLRANDFRVAAVATDHYARMEFANALAIANRHRWAKSRDHSHVRHAADQFSARRDLA